MAFLRMFQVKCKKKQKGVHFMCSSIKIKDGHGQTRLWRTFSTSGCRWCNKRLFVKSGCKAKPNEESLRRLTDGGNRSNGQRSTAWRRLLLDYLVQRNACKYTSLAFHGKVTLLMVTSSMRLNQSECVRNLAHYINNILVNRNSYVVRHKVLLSR